MAQPVSAYIGLGSNLDDPDAQLRQAIAALSAHAAMTLTDVSSLYRSPPMGPQDQPEFSNAVVRVTTHLTALDLLDVLQAREAAQNRRRERRWGPRTLDLDLLLYGDTVIDTDRLRVPHPGLHERAFVLYPLAELAPEQSVPGRGIVRDLLRVCPAFGLRRVQSDGTTVAAHDD